MWNTIFVVKTPWTSLQAIISSFLIFVYITVNKCFICQETVNVYSNKSTINLKYILSKYIYVQYIIVKLITSRILIAKYWNILSQLKCRLSSSSSTNLFLFRWLSLSCCCRVYFLYSSFYSKGKKLYSIPRNWYHCVSSLEVLK